FFSSRRRHTRFKGDWSSDVCSSDLRAGRCSAKWIERGAAAFKCLPNSQNIDPRDKRCEKIFDLLAAKKVPLIAHTGGEHTVTVRSEERRVGKEGRYGSGRQRG